MSDIRAQIKAEFENIDRVLERIPSPNVLPNLSELELAGVAALLHSFYNGIENILKRAVLSQGLSLSSGATWHRDLVESAYSAKIISSETLSGLKSFLAL